jgi:hypothetical protein
VSEPLQLAEASKRLRKRPGRPRNQARPVAGQASGHVASPPLARANERTVAVVWLKRGDEWTPATARLLGLTAAAAYVGMSTWTLRGWLADGVLHRVRLPRPGGGEIERLLIDVADLDRLVAEGKA